LLYTTSLFKNPSFSEKLFIKQKALQLNANCLNTPKKQYMEFFEYYSKCSTSFIELMPYHKDIIQK